MRLIRRLSAIPPVVLLCTALLPAAPSRAVQTTFIVSMRTDPPPVQCLPQDCSLREAILAANAEAGPNTILLPGGTYTLQLPGVDDASLVGDLDLTDDTTIEAFNGPATVAANGGVTGERAFHILSGASTFLDVSVKGGTAPFGMNNPARGGGIRVQSRLTMYGGTVSGNSAPGTAGLGGGIYNAGGLTLYGTIVEDNDTELGFGGGIANDAPGANASLHGAVISGNSSVFGGALAGRGSMTVEGSLLRGNSASLGGAVYAAAGSSFYISDSTISGNTASDRGGAIRARNGSVALGSSTVTGNSALVDAGGISTKDDNGTTAVTLTNTILAGNLDEDTGLSAGPFPDCYQESADTFLSNGYNLLGETTGCIFPATLGDQVGPPGQPIDPMLGPLAFNGGPTPELLTHPLLPGSPAIDQGGFCGQTDARGVPRSLGGSCDIGAYELVACRGVVVNRVGTAGDDSSSSPSLKPTKGDDGILGLGGDDQLRGGGGNDALCGGAGNDTIKGTAGDDTIVGGRGDDRLVGGRGEDLCIGGPGQDTATACERVRGIP